MTTTDCHLLTESTDCEWLGDALAAHSWGSVNRTKRGTWKVSLVLDGWHCTREFATEREAIDAMVATTQIAAATP